MHDLQMRLRFPSGRSVFVVRLVAYRSVLCNPGIDR